MDAPLDPIERRLADTLAELQRLLSSVGEDHWAQWAAVTEQEARRHDPMTARHVLAAYGGMGSLTDLVIHPRNGHRVDAAQVDAVNDRLRGLVGAAYDDANRLARGDR